MRPLATSFKMLIIIMFFILSSLSPQIDAPKSGKEAIRSLLDPLDICPNDRFVRKHICETCVYESEVLHFSYRRNFYEKYPVSINTVIIGTALPLNYNMITNNLGTDECVNIDPSKIWECVNLGTPYNRCRLKSGYFRYKHVFSNGHFLHDSLVRVA